VEEKITIDAVGASDVGTAVALLTAQLDEHDIGVAAERLRAVVETVATDQRHGFMLLASVAGRAVGIAYAAAHLSAEHGGLIGWLEELYVVPECRGRGVGSLLLAEVIARAQQLHWCGVELEVVAGHERAAALYLREGFVPVPRARYSRIFN
jgi:[ribosomal protein S18]-alanine N-acetyltransferase